MYYFDNSATTQPDSQVMETYLKVSQDYFANPSSVHKLGVRSHQLLDAARKQVSEILGFASNEIYFTSSGTESNNWALQAIVDHYHDLHPNKSKLLISSIEHASMTKQFDLLKERGYQVELIPVDSQGFLNYEWLHSHLDNQVLLVSTMLVNNEVGMIQDLDRLTALLKQFPQVIWHVDAVQAVTTCLDECRHERIDLLSLSSHKFHAPRGVGILAKRSRIENQPFIYGGGQEMGQRSSTENLAAIVATAQALRKMSEQQGQIKQKLGQFNHRIRQTLKENGWQVHSPESGASSHIICASFAPIPGEVLVHAFEAEEVYISTASACSSRVRSDHATLRAMGLADQESESAIRISMSSQTEATEVDYLLETIHKISRNLKIGE